MSLANLINVAFKYVVHTCKKYNIDESHSLKHSMDVFHFANKIYDAELSAHPILLKQRNIIAVSAIVHDMCDKKYMNEQEGIHEMKEYMKEYVKEPELEVISNIISTMSYSKVKVNGFPCMGAFQTAYNIVREADLLAAYDFDRCMIYNMKNIDPDLVRSFHSADELFNKRVFRHNDDNLFTTDYGKRTSLILHAQALRRIQSWKSILRV
jgi:hypothetical protein